MTNTVKNSFFEAKINSDTHTLERLTVFKADSDGVLDLTKFPEMDEVRCIGTGYYLMPYAQRVIDKMVLPKRVKKIRESAFYAAPIKAVVWPDDCFDIAQQTFDLCYIESLENIAHVKSIGKLAFANSRLKSLCIPNGVNVIPDSCFIGTPLNSLTNTEHLTEICKEAFLGTYLRGIHWPSRCTTIRKSTFDNCKKLSYIENTQGIEIIEKAAFSGCGLTSFCMPPKCRYINAETFSYCSSLTDVRNLDHIISIGHSAFASSGIQEIDLSNSVCSSIEDAAFAKSSLERFTPGYYLENIGETAFYGTPYERKENVDLN